MPKKKLKISIITPSFNQGQYIEATILSVVSQNYPNYEYFINDGGSTDNSVAIIKKCAKKYPQIVWQSKKDAGQVDAINQGLKKATGEIIAYINSDDYYLPGSLAQVARYFEQNPDKLWLVGGCYVTNKSLSWTFFLKKIWPINKSKNALKIFNTINQPAVFLTKKLVKKVGLFDEKYHFAFDYDYWLRCVKVGLPGRIDSNLSAFRVHNDSKGNTGFKRQFVEDYQVAQSHIDNQFILFIHNIGKNLTTFVYKFYK